MKINACNKIKLVLNVYKALALFPSFKKKISLLFRPFDAPRYIEFAYLNKVLKKSKTNNLNILDVSSPYIMSYLLSQKNNVIKTDIDSSEKLFINESKTLKFQIEDATKLTFSDNSFDLVYSVSVIEHIYEKYILAIKEMIRVTKSGGVVYVTFPVAKSFQEEWTEGDVYEKQYKEGNKVFFQYRFDEEKVKEIINEISTTFAFPYTPKQLRELIHSQYVGCHGKQYKHGCLGKVETKKCKTEIGVLGGDYAEKKHGGTSQWSIVNRFDTNSRVKKEIYNI